MARDRRSLTTSVRSLHDGDGLSNAVNLQVGRVDGFDPREAGGERNEGEEVSHGLFAAQGDAFEPLDLSNSLLDPGAARVARCSERPGSFGERAGR
jgi:hypothetical protein